MSVVGIDFGTLQSVIAVARNRGIDVICNEVSSRATPSLVSFGSKQRYLGESAKTQEVANYKNTVGSLIRLIGRKYSESDVQEIEAKFVNAPLTEVSGEVAVKVSYLETEEQFSATQLAAMYLSKLRKTAEKELSTPVSDVVLSCPSWFTDRQRRALKDAAIIAGLNPLRIMNDITASALLYGITKSDLPEDKPRNVVLVDVGYAHFTVGVVAYKKGKLEVKSVVCDSHLGGRDVDDILVKHFIEKFNKQHNMDIESNKKALFRLRVGCEKLKKILSANSQGPLNVESIMEDKDVHAMLSRTEFEEMIKELLDHIEPLLLKALNDAKLPLDEIESVELIGGTSRIPAIMTRISEFFGMQCSMTLNREEAVARGCALQCAALSPTFKVRPFEIADLTTRSVSIEWGLEEWDTVKETKHEVVKELSVLPARRKIELKRDGPFEVSLFYTHPEKLPGGMDPWIGNFTINKVKKTREDDDHAYVRVKPAINESGIAELSASLREVKEVEETVPLKEGETGEPKKEIKKVAHYHPLPVEGITGSLTEVTINRWRELEGEMDATDKAVALTAESRNALEEFVYDTRSKVESFYGEYFHDEPRQAFLAQLNEMEDWLYGDGEHAKRSEYVERLNSLKVVGDPVSHRYRIFQEMPKHFRNLQTAIAKYLEKVEQASSVEYTHITTEEWEKVQHACQDARNWLKHQTEVFNTAPKTADLPFTPADVDKKRQELYDAAHPIVTKKKPEPKPEKKENDVEMKDAGKDEAAPKQGDPMEVDDQKPVVSGLQEENLEQQDSMDGVE